MIKTSEPGGLVIKSGFDGAGRETISYATDGGGDSVYGDADDVTGDKVLEQIETLYDLSGNAVVVTNRQRFHDATDTGALGNPASTSPTAAARVSYQAFYYDAIDRTTAAADFGTNGGTLDGTGSGADLDTDNNSVADRPSVIPSRDDDVLVTSYDYDEAGLLKDVTDPRGIVDRTTYDMLGRTKKVIESYVDGTPSAADDRTTEYTYDGNGNVLTMKAVLPSSAFQETKYIYGEADKTVSGITRSGSTATATSTGHGYRVGESVTVSGAAQAEYNGTFVITAITTNTFSYTVTGTPVTPATGTITVRRAHDVYNNDVLMAVQYPDKSSGSASASEQESFTLNALGERKHFIDRNGSVHAYSYNVLGRPTSDHVTTLGTDVDGAVRKLGYTYDTAGRPEKFTSYNGSNAVVNEVQRAYNGLGQLITEYQEHAGAVNTGTSLKVQYAYSEMASGANHSRLKSVTYPNGRILRYEYSSGLDDTISRLSFLADDSSGSVGTHLEEYSYLGLGTVIKRAHPQSGVDLTFIKQGAEANGDAGDQYTGLDRFGRIVDQRWRKTSDGSHTDRFKYAYDRNGNRLWRENLVELYYSEAYFDPAAGGYDALDRLNYFVQSDIEFDYGNRTFSAGSINIEEFWQLDALGNWTSISGTYNQSRTHNKQNQLTQAGSSNLAFDNNGSTKTDDAGRTLGYDAWNRLGSVTPSGGSVTTYAYDALGRRIRETPAGGTARELYYSSQWQVLEEREGSAVKVQNVWSPVYVDAMVLRDRDTVTGGGLEERLYAQHDANFNVTALVNTSGTVVERYVYDPYGAVTVLDANWAADADGASDVGWQYLHQGGRYDAAAGLYHFRNRDYSPTLGRWLQQDPKGYIDGLALYQYVGSNPTTFVDPLGTCAANCNIQAMPLPIGAQCPAGFDRYIFSMTWDSKFGIMFSYICVQCNGSCDHPVHEDVDVPCVPDAVQTIWATPTPGGGFLVQLRNHWFCDCPQMIA